MKHAYTGCALGELKIAFRQQAGNSRAIRLRVLVLHGCGIRPSLHVINETQSTEIRGATQLVIIGVLVGWDAMLKLHPVEGVYDPVIPTFHELMLFGIRHPVEIDLLSANLTEGSPEY
jgi:hypothetical protein